MITCSTKFGGSAIDSTPARDVRIHCPKTLMFSQKYQRSDAFFFVETCVQRGMEAVLKLCIYITGRNTSSG